MYKILCQRQPRRPAKVLPEGILPVSVEWSNKASPATLSFSDRDTSAGSCIRCIHPPCIEYTQDELRQSGAFNFPADLDNRVCPTSAIEWPVTSPSPSVDSDQCILCGICVSRCPVRAIYLTESGAKVNDDPNTHFQLSEVLSTPELTYETTTKFRRLRETGSYMYETDDLLLHFRSNLERVSADQQSQFPNLLARNLFITLGLKAAMRRRGDTNVRMDLLMDYGKAVIGPGEVEYGAAILDVPRNLLDDVAVMVSRYEVGIDRIIPLAVCVSLPNQRSEFWEVIGDIHKVLGIAVSTTTVGVLVIMVWNRASLDADALKGFRLTRDLTSLIPATESILGRHLDLTQGGYPGLFESGK